jgi:hypothetical protein
MLFYDPLDGFHHIVKSLELKRYVPLFGQWLEISYFHKNCVKQGVP